MVSDKSYKNTSNGRPGLVRVVSQTCDTVSCGKFLIIGVEGANFFNSTKRGKERGRGGRGGERGGRGRRGRGGNIADVLCRRCVDILACGGPFAAARARIRVRNVPTRGAAASMAMPADVQHLADIYYRSMHGQLLALSQPDAV